MFLTMMVTIFIYKRVRRWHGEKRTKGQSEVVQHLTSNGYPKNASRTILLTGFGPFGEFQANPSWECVKTLQGQTLQGHGIECVQLPVEYEQVEELVPALLEKHNPLLLVLCGVSAASSTVKLETTASNGPYTKADNRDYVPPKGVAREGGELLKSMLRLKLIARKLNEAGHKVDVSKDAGGYLCDYSFYIAMGACRCPSVVVHVPPVQSDTEAGADVVKCIRSIVEECVHDIGKVWKHELEAATTSALAA